jgi:hypothetical protein
MQVAALCYCNQYLTDGFVPRSVASGLLDFEGLGMRMWMGELAGGGQDASWELVVDDLLAAKLWEQVEGGYRIHDYHDYQPSRAAALALRAKRSAAGHKGGQARAKANAKQVPEQPSSKTEASAQAESKPVPVPVPVPVTVPTEGFCPSGETDPERLEGLTVVAENELRRPVSVDRQVFDFWTAERHKNGNVRFTSARKAVVQAALKAGYTTDDMRDAIRGVALDPWPDRPQHDDLIVILRLGGRGNRNNLEHFRDLWRSGPPVVRTAQQQQMHRTHAELSAWAEEVDRDRNPVGQAGRPDQRQLRPPAARA